MPHERTHTPPSEWCPHPERWSAADGDAAEDEVGRLLYGLTVAIKPAIAVETGTYHGHTAACIGSGLRDNDRGRLYTLEVDTTSAAIAQAWLYALPVTIVNRSSIGWVPPGPIGLLYLDSSMEARPEELSTFKSFLEPGAIVVLHDTAPHHHNRALALVKQWGWPAVTLRTPRGVSICQAVR